MQFTAVTMDARLVDLPWDIPLARWPDERLIALPRGISRHVVRFVDIEGTIFAVKEIVEDIAQSEYRMLRHLQNRNEPSVKPTAVVSGRRGQNGEALMSALVTEHLSYSLPYRALFSKSMRTETVRRLIDSLAVLIVRLHLGGFYWGDVSLSNTLFRRDAGAFAAYLVDAETAELYPHLSQGQREYDIDLARTNIIGEMMDLQCGSYLDEETDVIAIGDRLVDIYHTLWTALTAEEKFKADERWRIDARIRRLNDLGFDVGEITMKTEAGGTVLKLRPKVVDAGHYHRQVMRLTGLDVEEQQAKRMINDLKTYRAALKHDKQPIEVTAHQWLRDVFEPTVEMVPYKLRHKLEDAQLFHEILEHRWYMSERRGRDVGTVEAVKSYTEKELSKRPDEHMVVNYATSDDAIDDGFSNTADEVI